jgi:hypothetical protein
MKHGLGIDDIEYRAFKKALPDKLQIESNDTVKKIMDGDEDICKNYDNFLEEYKQYSNEIQYLYSTIRAAMIYKANANAIISRVQYFIDIRRNDNAKPPGINDCANIDDAKKFIRASLIDF